MLERVDVLLFPLPLPNKYWLRCSTEGENKACGSHTWSRVLCWGSWEGVWLPLLEKTPETYLLLWGAQCWGKDTALWEPRGDAVWPGLEEWVENHHGGMQTERDSGQGEGVQLVLAHSRYFPCPPPPSPELSRVPKVSGECGSALWPLGVWGWRAWRGWGQMWMDPSAIPH